MNNSILPEGYIRPEGTWSRVPDPSLFDQMRMNSLLDDDEAGLDDLLHAGQVVVPDDLGLLPPTEHLRRMRGVEDLRHLHQQPLVNGQTCLAPVDHFIKWKLPAVGQNDRKTACLKRLQKSKRSQTSASRNQTESRI